MRRVTSIGTMALTRGLAVIALASCATLAEGGGGDTDLPNAGAGPFRKLVAGELGHLRSEPYALDDDAAFARDPAVVDVDGDPATFDVYGYFAVTLAPEGETAGPDDAANAIVRHEATDARSFDRPRTVVLEPALAWEGATVGAPMVMRRGAELWMYYAAAGGIGLARSSDGAVFTREDAPVLAPAEGGWEGGATPTSPGVVALGDGSLRMFFEVPRADGRTSIGEARSDDGVTWTRLGDGPALAPSAPASGDNAPYDDGGVGSPFPVLAASATGRPILRVYYGALDGAGVGTVALAARHGDDGALVRATAPVFGTGESLGPRDPCVLAYDAFSLLFVTQRAGKTKGKAYPAIAAGVAPALATLPPASPD